MDSQPAPSPSESIPEAPQDEVLVTLPFAFAKKVEQCTLRPTEATQTEKIPLLRNPLQMDIILKVNEISARMYRFLRWPPGASVEIQNDPSAPDLAALFLRFADGRHQMFASGETPSAALELHTAINEGLNIRWDIHLHRSGKLTATPDTFWLDDVGSPLQTPRLQADLLLSILELRELPKEYELQPLSEGVLPFVSEETVVHLSSLFPKLSEPITYGYRSMVLAAREQVLRQLQSDFGET